MIYLFFEGLIKYLICLKAVFMPMGIDKILGMYYKVHVKTVLFVCLSTYVLNMIRN